MKNQPMFKTYSVLFFFLLLTNFGFGQTKEIDSLKQLISETNQNQQKVNLYINLYLKTKNSSNTAVEYLNRAEHLIDKSVNDSTRISWFIHKADYFLFQGNYDKTFSSLDKALLVTNKHAPKLMIDAYALKGQAYYHKGDYENAIETYFSGLKISDSLQLVEQTARLYNNIGISYIKLENWSKAEQYMKESLKICKELELKGGTSFTLGNLGIIYRNQNKYASALNMYEQSIEISESLNDQRAIARTNSSIGELYQEKNDFKTSIKHYTIALDIMTTLSDKQSMSVNYLRLGNVYSKLNNFAQARYNFEEGLRISDKAGILNNSMKIHEGLSNLYEANGDYKKAFTERKLFDVLKDSIKSKDHIAAISKMDIQYETEKKDKEIAEQQLAIADQELALTQSKSKTRLMSILIVSLLSASILLWFLFQQRQKRIQQQLVTIQREQEVRTLESLMEGEEKERFRIAKELHDGVNGDLSAIKFKLSSLLEMNNSVIKEAVAMIDNSCEQVRAISHNLVPPSLKNFSLLEAVDEYCQSMNSIHELEVHFQQVGGAISLDKKQEANLFRIIQELVTNSIKHADANEINVQLSHLENTLQLTVEDNGKGFDPKTVKSDGIGMQNVQSRVDYLNAKMDFVSNEKGTSYTIAMDTKIEKS